MVEFERFRDANIDISKIEAVEKQVEMYESSKNFHRTEILNSMEDLKKSNKKYADVI